jgi:hypothetical protein
MSHGRLLQNLPNECSKYDSHVIDIVIYKLSTIAILAPPISIGDKEVTHLEQNLSPV